MVTLNEARNILSTGVTDSEQKYHLTQKRFFDRLIASIVGGSEHILIPKKGTIHTYALTLTKEKLELVEESTQGPAIHSRSFISMIPVTKPKIPLKITIDNKRDIAAIEKAVFRARMEVL